METVYDWLTMAIFSGLVVLFLQRSTLETPPDTIWHYMPPSIACAVANYLGNKGYEWASYAILIGIGAYIIVILNVRFPVDRNGQP